MRHITMAACLVCLILTTRTPAGKDVDPEIKKVLDRAVTALGGAESLTKHPGVSWKGKGKYKQADISVVFEVEAHHLGFDRFRHDLALGDQSTTFTLVITGDKSWVKTDTVMPIPDRLEPLRANFYAMSLSQHPHALAAKAFTLSALGEVQVEGRPTLGLRVSQKSWPDVCVYYDKESGLPVKSEVQIKDPATAQEVMDEFFLSDYRDFDGRKHYTKVVGKRNGEEYMEREISAVRWHEELAADLFAMP